MIAATTHHGDHMEVSYFPTLTVENVNACYSYNANADRVAAMQAELDVWGRTNHGWTRFESLERLDADGRAYLAVYLAPFAFVWDGRAAYVEIAHGGMGEPVTDAVAAPKGVTNDRECFDALLDIAHEYIRNR